MIEALQTLEAIEQRSQFEILADIQQASFDIIRWRIIQEDSGDGAIPLEDGQLFITQLLAAAQPMQWVANRKPAAATEYMRHVRLGQSERGSYVVTVQSPVPPALPIHGIDDQPDPFERRVSLTLANALHTLRQVAMDAVDTDNLQTANWAEHGRSAPQPACSPPATPAAMSRFVSHTPPPAPPRPPPDSVRTSKTSSKKSVASCAKPPPAKTSNSPVT